MTVKMLMRRRYPPHNSGRSGIFSGSANFVDLGVVKMPCPNRVILVVEDTAVIRLLAVELLVQAGFEVLEAECADEAIQILQGRPDIHLVFTDVNMPGTMDGIRLSHYIRDRWPPVKLVVASGQAIVDESHLPTGARFFAKPYHGGELVEAIIAMLPEVSGEAATC